MSSLALSARDLWVTYGSVNAVRGIDLDIVPGTVTAILGPNGAGKTSVIRGMSGCVRHRAAELTFYGRDIRSLGTARRALLGIVEVPEGRGILGRLTVKDNILLGLEWVSLPRDKHDVVEEVFQKYPVLYSRQDEPASALSGGEQQLLAVARARAIVSQLDRHCLLLDEPSLGLSPRMVSELYADISELRDRRATVVLVEQNVRAALAVADRVLLMERGVITADGSPEDMSDDPRIRDAYLPEVHPEGRNSES